MQEQVQQRDKPIARRFDAIDRPIKSISGLGSVVAPVILSELGELSRFKGAKATHKMLAYAGAPTPVFIKAANGQDRSK